MSTKKLLALVLAGGQGTRLRPLTTDHSKPALPLAEGYRIIDFVLSNLVNSQVTEIYVLVQYRPRSLVEHLRTAWAPWCTDGGGGISVVSPGAGAAGGSFKGTADAVYKNLHLIDRHRPDLVAVFAADHVYRMDVRQMAEFHHAARAEVTIAAIPVPIKDAPSFGIMVTGPAGELRDFQEKPERPLPIPADPGRAYASMGNYLFDPEILAELLVAANERGETDFGRHLLPRLVHGRRAFAYNFACNKIAGVEPYEEPGYWRDIGTIEAFEAARRDVQGPLPRFRLANPQWPILGGSSLHERSIVFPPQAPPLGNLRGNRVASRTAAALLNAPLSLKGRSGSTPTANTPS